MLFTGVSLKKRKKKILCFCVRMINHWNKSSREKKTALPSVRRAVRACVPAHGTPAQAPAACPAGVLRRGLRLSPHTQGEKEIRNTSKQHQNPLRLSDSPLPFPNCFTTPFLSYLINTSACFSWKFQQR